MLQTIEAEIDEYGNVQLFEPIHLSKKHRAYVTILSGEKNSFDTAMLSEAALAKDWNRPEADSAWEHLQEEPLS